MQKTAAASDSTLLQPYQFLIEANIRKAIASFCQKDDLRDACEYALMNGGKRFRPALAMMVAHALGYQADVGQAALTVEFFHTASLVADDLPCMDDDDERRKKPAVHKVYGEAMALLVSYALIAAGYEGIAANGHAIRNSSLPYAKNSDRLIAIALENAAYNTGLQGATGGQFLDINPPDLSLPTLRKIIHKKTVSLFEIAFVFGWIFGGGDLNLLPTVKKGASHFGMAFQIADDLGDVEQDALNGRKVNIAAAFGENEAMRMFHEEMTGYHKSLRDLGINSDEMRGLGSWLVK